MLRFFLFFLIFAGFANAQMYRSASQEVVWDSDTKLMWQDNSEAKTVERNWQGAIDYCQNLKLAGFDDWRLPDLDTLKVLYPKKSGLKNIVSVLYWSSSPSVSDSSSAWGVYFYDGNGYDNLKSFSLYVRCVRDSSSLRQFDLTSLLNRWKNSKISNSSIELVSKEVINGEIMVSTNGQNIFGTEKELFEQFSNQKFSSFPFEDIQKLTQKDIDSFLFLATIDEPDLPSPLNLIKDEFESKAEFAKRVEAETQKREALIAKLQSDFRAKVEARNRELEIRKSQVETKTKEFLFQNFALVMGSPVISNPVFDAESDTMFVDLKMSNADWAKKVAIKISSRELARNFKQNIDKVEVKTVFGYQNNAFILQDISASLGSNNLIATLSADDFKPQKVEVVIKSDKVKFGEFQNPNLVDKYRVSALEYGESGAVKKEQFYDDLAPVLAGLSQKPIDNKKWIFAIGIEDYAETDDIIFAKRSAETFVKTMQKSFGVSERNTYSLIDTKATSGSIKDKMKLLAGDVKDGDTIYFYYNGHGIPNVSDDGEPFMLPSDKIPDFITKEEEFSLRQIYKQLSDTKAAKIIAVVDSCFAGATDGVSQIKGVAATRMKPKKIDFDKQKMVVITAGKDKKFSNMYKEKGHRMFSYYVIESILKGKQSVVDLYREASYKTSEASNALGSLKKQEPTIDGNIELKF